MRVRDIMTRGVLTVPIYASVQQVAALMRSHGIGGVPVMDEDRVVGFVTDRDIVVRGFTLGGAEDGDPRFRPVSDVMSRDLVTCADSDDLNGVAAKMSERRVRRVIALDANGRVAGIVSLDDLAQRASGTEFSSEVLKAAARGFPIQEHRAAAESDRFSVELANSPFQPGVRMRTP